jgi:preprotein translocase subunit YajC
MMDVQGIVALCLIFLTPTAIAVVAIISSYKEKKRRYESLIKALELGKKPEEIKEIFAAEKRTKGPNGMGFLKGGIVVIGISVGLAFMGLFLPAAAESGLFAGAALIVVLGISLIFVYLVSRKKEKAE